MSLCPESEKIDSKTFSVTCRQKAFHSDEALGSSPHVSMWAGGIGVLCQQVHFLARPQGGVQEELSQPQVLEYFCNFSQYFNLVRYIL